MNGPGNVTTAAPPLLSPSRSLVVLAAPVLAEEVLNILVGYTDFFLASRFLPGDEYKAAMGLVAYSLWLIPSLFACISIGVLALVARFVGEGNIHLARRATQQALLAGFVLAAVVTAAVYYGGETYVDLMNFSGPSAVYATRYLRWFVPAIFFVMCEQVGTACLRGAGDMITGLVARVIMNVVNMALSTMLITGWGLGIKLGWDALPLAAATAHGVGGAIILGALLRHPQLGWRLTFTPDWPLLRRLFRIGVPGGVDVLALIICHMTYFSIISSLGTQATAAHSLGVQIESLAYLPGSAFAIAAATLVGQNLGARLPQRARRCALLACMMGGGIMCAAGCVFFFAGHYFTAFFTGSVDDPTGQLTARLLKVVALSMPSLALVSILTGSLRGAGDTRATLWITFAGLVVIRLPGAAWLALDSYTVPGLGIEITGWGLGVFGAWYAMVTDVVFRSLLVSWRFAGGAWQRTTV